MKKTTLTSYILLSIIAFIVWLGGSWWHYACNIKNTCSPEKITATKQVIDTDDDGLSEAMAHPIQKKSQITFISQ